MRTITISLPQEVIEEATRLYREYEEQIKVERKQKHMPGPSGINHILRMAIEMGLLNVPLRFE